MVYIFFLFDTVKPPVNSQHWFICFKNNKQHTAPVGDKRLPVTLFSLCVCVWNQLLLLQLNPLSLLVSASDTLFGFMPKRQSAVPPDFLLMAFILKAGCRFEDACIVFTVLDKISAVLNLMSHSIAQVSLLKHTHRETRAARARTRKNNTFVHVLHFERTIPWGQTHDQQMGAGCFGWVVCLCAGASESYLCHHEYVIKLPLRKDDVLRQGVHKAGTRALFCFHAKLVMCIVVYWDSERGGAKGMRDRVGNKKMGKLRTWINC